MSMPSRLRAALLSMLIWAMSASAALAQPTYDITFLPVELQAAGIDNGGRIVGVGSDPEGFRRAFVWSAGSTTLLPTLGGASAFATAVDNGIVVGASTSGDATRGFLYRNGVIEGIGTLYGGDSVAYGVNAAGQVVGESTDASGNSRAFLYGGGTLRDLGTLGGADARARDINNAGAIVGGSQPGPEFPNDGAHAFLYVDGVMSDLGTLGGGFSWANAINDAGQVAGYSLIGGDAAVWRPFLYSGGAMIDLGSFGGDYGEAHDLNEAGQVVGLASLPGFGFSHAFLYADGTLHDLNDLVDLSGAPVGFTLTDAVGINDAGQIAVLGCNGFGECASALLSPVPEPGQGPLLLAGLPPLLLLLRRRRACR